MNSIRDRITSSKSYLDTSALDNLRRTDFARLDIDKHVYLDYTGGNLYPDRLVEQHADILKGHVFGNPHSSNPTSRLSTDFVDTTRRRVLEYFNCEDDYHCIFTANASGALKIVGECYPFHSSSHFALLFDNHNSVNGIREFAHHKGARVTYCPLFLENLRADESFVFETLEGDNSSTDKLFAYPAQSNVSGVKHPLSWIEKAHNNGWDVLLDSAAFAPTNKLDLQVWKPEFVSLSFYKIFGYPTGIGALLVRNSVFAKLTKPWFAGGTVLYATVIGEKHILLNNYERFEDGTLNYLGLPAIANGLDFIESIGIDSISDRVRFLTELLLKELLALRHDNDRELMRIFGPQNGDARGGTIIFNILDHEGETIPYQTVENRANERNISLRTGCFCNPGIDEINSCINVGDVEEYFRSTKNITMEERHIFLGKMRGAVRISLGWVTNADDLAAFVEFVESFKNKSRGEC